MATIITPGVFDPRIFDARVFDTERVTVTATAIFGRSSGGPKAAGATNGGPRSVTGRTR